MQTVNEKTLEEMQTIAFKADSTSTSSFAIAATLKQPDEAMQYEQQGLAWKRIYEAALKAFDGDGTLKDLHDLKIEAYKAHGLSIGRVYGSYDASYRWAGKPEGFTNYDSFKAFQKAFEANPDEVEKTRRQLLDIAMEKSKQLRLERLLKN